MPHVTPPVPIGAVAGEWHEFTGAGEDWLRFLIWSRHNAGVVVVEGTQYADGRVQRHIAVRPDQYADIDVTATAARQLAVALLDAAEVMDHLGS